MSAPLAAPLGRFLPVGELLDLDDLHGAPCWGKCSRVAAARVMYCGTGELSLDQAQPCGGCGRSTITLVGGLPLHLTCPDPPAGWVPAAVPVPAAADADAAADAGAAGADAEPGEPDPGDNEPVPDRDAEEADTAAAEPGRAGGAGHLAAVLAADGLWLPGADAPVAAGWPQDAGEAWQLADQYGIRQLWIHPGAHEALGLPAAHGANPQAPEEHPWAQPAGYACDPPGLAAWMHVAPAGGGRRRAVVLAGYETRAAWPDAPSGQVLLGAVTALAGALPKGCSYYYSPNATATAVISHHARGGLPAVVMPPPAADRAVTHVASWSRPLADDEDGLPWLHRYDTNGAQLATWNVKLGTGAPVHDGSPAWVRGKSKYTAGYWLVSLDPAWRPDMRLPDLLIPWRRAHQERIWVPAPFLELLADDLNAPVTVHEAWTWPQSSARLEAAGHSFRDARATLAAQADGCGKCAPCIALRVVKDCYTSAIGYLARRTEVTEPGTASPGRGTAVRAADGTVTGPPLWDPYANDAIIAKALANDYRRQRRTGGATGRYPVAIFNDAAYYASGESDGRLDVPRTMILGPGLGQYSHEATVVLAAVAGELGGPRFHRAVERHLRGPR